MKNNISKYLDKVILYVFYFLILLSALYAVYGILYEDLICKLLLDNMEDGKDFVLLFAEHIFLYLLPISILLGFYSYYKETAHHILNNKEGNLDPNEALRLLNISKTIFLSSVLSYSLIKITEKIFLDKHYDVLTLASYGIFIIILMAYILIYHKVDGKDEKEK